jgi:Leucine-rich repeat (LRR) protein
MTGGVAGKDKPTIEERDDGVRWIVVKSGWSPEVANLINSGRADGLELNSAAASWEDGLPFLREVPGLKHLILIDLHEQDVHLIEELHGLEGLKLSAYAASPLDFARLTALRKAFIEWRRQYRNISACTNLEELYLNRYWEKDLAALLPLQKVSKLTVGDSPALLRLDGVEEMSQLRSLSLRGLPKLRELSPIRPLAATLEELNMKQCRYLRSLEPLSGLSNLRRLSLEDCGKVPSLRPISQLRALRVLYFSGDTNVLDGDLDFLRTLPLQDVAFKNRRHYSVRQEELASWHP